jgi:hypothetical protein
MDQSCTAHRVAFAHFYGHWPTDKVDHINQNRSDNRIENLRDVSPQENSQNQKLSKRNTSGVTGVTWHNQRKKWMAQITVSLKTHTLGIYEKKADAIAARKDAERRFGFSANHGT